VKNTHKSKVVVIGGGTGTFTILSGLKKYPQLNISVIVSMMDDGGSNRVIRDEFGLLPTSDLRQCMVALAGSDSDETLRKLFTYRYENGVGIAGMTFGNLFMAALTDIYGGDQKKAIEETCELLGVNGKIIPVTLEKTNLVATYENGKQILGEHEIDEPNKNIGKSRIMDLQVFPKITVNKDALIAIRGADLIILGPGDFYTSILPNVVVDGIAHEIVKSHGKVVFVMNLMTKYGQTIGFKTSTFVSEINKYLGKDPDIVLINSAKKIPSSVLKKYEAEKAELVPDDLKKTKMKVVKKQLISNKVYEKPKSDKLVRSLIRHDSEKLAKAIVELL
jgi:uncharacterized cofD-like protein